ncbi:unnamed protein product [Tilletia caries]|nr:hypothetical protein CF335_g1166 [Tilletia laevis]CAD6887746.1 unnamed protein product [Tilletia caries]
MALLSRRVPATVLRRSHHHHSLIRCSSSSSSSPPLPPDESKITALPFLLSTADAVSAARTCATSAAHWDERGTLDGFSAYAILSKLGITPYFGIGKKYEDEIVSLEQSAAVYLPTWIVDASLLFAASGDAGKARTSLLLEHARFPGSTWSPISSLPLWPTNNLFSAESASILSPLQPQPESSVYADANVPEYEPWQPDSHLTIGRTQDYLDSDNAVEIDGPITALPFELTPLALPAFLKSIASSSSSSDTFELSTRQPPTVSEMVILFRNAQHELRSVSEAEKIEGIELGGRMSKRDGLGGMLDQIQVMVGRLFGLRSTSNGQSPAEARTQREREKREEEELEKRKQRTVRLDPNSLEVDMLAAYPVMLPMHILKFSYQPKVSLKSTTSSRPTRKSITVAVAGWDPTATHILRTLPSTCSWSPWGRPTDSIMGYDTSLPDHLKPEPPSALRFSPLNVARFEMIPAAPVELPAGAAAFDEALSEAKESLFGGVGADSASEAARLHAEMLLSLSPASTPPPSEESQTKTRDTLVHHLLRYAFKTLVVQMLQFSLGRRANEWVNAADRDWVEGKQGEIGWARYREFQDQMLEKADESLRTPGLASLSSSSPSTPSPAEADNDKDEYEDDDPALPDPRLLASVHIQPFDSAANANRKYLAALAQRTRADAMHALAESGDAVVFMPVRAEGEKEEEREEGGVAAGPSVEDVMSGAVSMKLAEGADARKATARQVDTLAKLVDESKPEWLRVLHESERVAQSTSETETEKK